MLPGEKRPGYSKKLFKLVMPAPVSCIFDRDMSCIPEVPSRTLAFALTKPGLAAAYQQYWRFNSVPQCLSLLKSQSKRRHHTGIVVKFPTITPVFILVTAVDSQVSSLISAQMLVGLASHELNPEGRVLFWL